MVSIYFLIDCIIKILFNHQKNWDRMFVIEQDSVLKKYFFGGGFASNEVLTVIILWICPVEEK